MRGSELGVSIVKFSSSVVRLVYMSMNRCMQNSICRCYGGFVLLQIKLQEEVQCVD